MATVLVRFRCKGFWISIGALEIWLHLLAHQIEQMSEVPVWLKEFGDAADRAAKSTAVQYLMPELDRYLIDDDRISTIKSLITGTVASTMHEFRSAIPKSVLNSWGTGGGVRHSTFNADLPTWKVARIAAAYARLIAGEIEEPLERARILDLMTNGDEPW